MVMLGTMLPARSLCSHATGLRLHLTRVRNAINPDADRNDQYGCDHGTGFRLSARIEDELVKSVVACNRRATGARVMGAEMPESGTQTH